MAFDAFLKIEGVDGESTRTGFEKQIELLSFSWGASNTANVGSSGAGGGAGKASVSSFNCLKATDAASPPPSIPPTFRLFSAGHPGPFGGGRIGP